jgi:hypothetical protein
MNLCLLAAGKGEEVKAEVTRVEATKVATTKVGEVHRYGAPASVHARSVEILGKSEYGNEIALLAKYVDFTNHHAKDAAFTGCCLP